MISVKLFLYNLFSISNWILAFVIVYYICQVRMTVISELLIVRLPMSDSTFSLQNLQLTADDFGSHILNLSICDSTILLSKIYNLRRTIFGRLLWIYRCATTRFFSSRSATHRRLFSATYCQHVDVWQHGFLSEIFNPQPMISSHLLWTCRCATTHFMTHCLKPSTLWYQLVNMWQQHPSLISEKSGPKQGECWSI